MNHSTKKLMIIVGGIIAVVALSLGISNGISMYNVTQLIGGSPEAALYQAIVTGIFSFFVYAFIGVIGTTVLTIFAAVIISIFSSGKKDNSAPPTDTTSPANPPAGSGK